MMKIASGHRYYLLVVSVWNRWCAAGDRELEELGRYFDSPARLLDGVPIAGH